VTSCNITRTKMDFLFTGTAATVPSFLPFETSTVTIGYQVSVGDLPFKEEFEQVFADTLHNSIVTRIEVYCPAYGVYRNYNAFVDFVRSLITILPIRLKSLTVRFHFSVVVVEQFQQGLKELLSALQRPVEIILKGDTTNRENVDTSQFVSFVSDTVTTLRLVNCGKIKHSVLSTLINRTRMNLHTLEVNNLLMDMDDDDVRSQPQLSNSVPDSTVIMNVRGLKANIPYTFDVINIVRRFTKCTAFALNIDGYEWDEVLVHDIGSLSTPRVSLRVNQYILPTRVTLPNVTALRFGEESPGVLSWVRHCPNLMALDVSIDNGHFLLDLLKNTPNLQHLVVRRATVHQTIPACKYMMNMPKLITVKYDTYKIVLQELELIDQLVIRLRDHARNEKIANIPSFEEHVRNLARQRTAEYFETWEQKKFKRGYSKILQEEPLKDVQLLHMLDRNMLSNVRSMLGVKFFPETQQ
jgi:hypothetical protein